MQQYPYEGPQPQYEDRYGAPQGQYGHSPAPKEKKSYVVIASISIGCAVFAMIAPLHIVDVIVGVVGIILAAIAMKGGTAARALAIAGLAQSILGTLIAIGYTIYVLDVVADGWVLMLQLFIR